MKLSALLWRAKGRDFYDTIFLFAQTQPDYEFLEKRTGIGTPAQLRQAIEETLTRTDLNIKKRDFEHLLFSSQNSEKNLHFPSFIADLHPD